jgi:hypothetical protein
VNAVARAAMVAKRAKDAFIVLGFVVCGEMVARSRILDLEGDVRRPR